MTLKSQYVLLQLVSDTGIETVPENLISMNRPHHLSEPKCRFPIQRLSLIYLVKEQLVAETSQQRTFHTKSALLADFAATYDKWWSYAGSNRGPLECKSSALPAEL